MDMRGLFGQKNRLSTSVLGCSMVVLALAGCGGGGGNNTVTTTPGSASGIVADGYLSGATVCLDINLNKICDAGEPSATTGTGGAYTLDVADATQLAQYPVLVEVPATAVDEDTGAAVGKKFVLSAPVGNSDFISPLTTMVQNQIEANPDLTVDEAEDALITSMGKDPASVSLFIDYVEAKNDPDNTAADDYNTLHNIAQVTARTLANNIETIEAAIADGSVNLTIDEAFDALIQIVVEEVVAQLAVITADVETAEATSGDGTIDADAVTTSTNVVVDTATVETEVAVVEATNSASSATFQQQLTDGFNWIWGEIGSDWQELEYGTVTVVGGVASETQSQFNFSTGAFEGSTSSSGIFLGANGWTTGSDDLSDCSVVFNSDGSGTFTCPMGAFTVSSQEVDVTGLNVAAYLGSAENGGFASLIDSTATFSSGAKGYIMSFTSEVDSYELYSDSGSYVLSTGAASTTLGDLLSSAAWVNDDNSEPKAVWAGFNQSPEGCIEEAYSSNPATDTLCTRSQGMIIELVGSGTSGTANFYLTDYVNRNTTSNFHSVNKVAASAWSIQTVNGAEILTYETPASVTSTYAYLFEDNSDGEQRIYSVYNNAVYEGDYTPAGASNSGEVAFNNTAIADVINSITGGSGGGTGGTGGDVGGGGTSLTCTTESGWDDTADGGLGAPITPYSFADFETVVADCGTAGPITRADVAGNSFDEFGETTTFNDTGAAATAADPETGSFDDGAGFVISFEWYIEDATCAGCTHSYLVLYSGSTIDSNFPAGFEIRETNAVTGVSGSTFTFTTYSEGSNYGDMVRSSGADGEIWSSSKTQIP